MRRVAKMAWGIFTPLFLTCALFLITASPARAPRGGKNSLGGRTIASIQEEDFDRQLLRYRLCYGVRFDASKATLERRRVCKAILVHKLDTTLMPVGVNVKNSLDFRCENTALGRNVQEGDLRPNAEEAAIEAVLEKNLEQLTSVEREDIFARDACSYLTDCKFAMSSHGFSLRKIAQCLIAPSATHRKILMDEMGNMIFHHGVAREKSLYAEMIREARR